MKSAMNAISKYINDALEELRHVRWPTRNQAIRLSTIVVIFVIICAAFFGAIDYALSQGLKFILSLT
jgi:preprotein translocase SecE subunit